MKNINPYNTKSRTSIKSASSNNKKSAQQRSLKGSGFVRIIGGSHKGRKLPVLDSEGLRPTTDRVKETLFNWLMFLLHDKVCLDLFSGSGSLGFEAQSRGANSVTMIEKDPKVYANLQQCKQLLKADNITVLHTDALTFLQNTTTKFDLIFLDPPFRKGILAQVYALLNANIVADGAFIYVEEEGEQQCPPPAWMHLHKESKAGQVHYRLYQVQW